MYRSYLRGRKTFSTPLAALALILAGAWYGQIFLSAAAHTASATQALPRTRPGLPAVATARQPRDM